MRMMATTDRHEAPAALLQLAHALGTPPRSYAILGEGNVSLRLDDGTFLVKASGTSLAAATAESFVRCDLARVAALVQVPPPDDEGIARALAASRFDGEPDPGGAVTEGRPAPRPSVETGMHAVLLGATGARCIAHTHPVPVVGILASQHAEALVSGALFPDQIVVCGAHPLLLPYVDPGVPLARALVTALESHVRTYGAPPKTIYLRNHGLVALGRSEAEALAVTDMAVKAAEVLGIALRGGGPHYLPEEEVRRIAARADEHHRQRVLGLHADDDGIVERAVKEPTS
jgi:rhamnose utilization protein RhaD (predicted bifunctional aldolase and dehydrogenase)